MTNFYYNSYTMMTPTSAVVGVRLGKWFNREKLLGKKSLAKLYKRVKKSFEDALKEIGKTIPDGQEFKFEIEKSFLYSDMPPYHMIYVRVTYSIPMAI